MPELPEVETIKKDLKKILVGNTILDLETDTPKMVKPSLSEVEKAVKGVKIKAVERRAKMLLVRLDNGKILAFHLKLTGRLLVRKKGEPKDSWQHVTFSLSGGSELRFADLRKFGWVKLVKEEELERLLADFGPEALDGLNLKEFTKILSSSRRPVKVVLMDQSKVSGIGNIYAADALNLAKIDPRRPADKVSEKESKMLFSAVEKVLKVGIKYRGASDQYYLDALGHKGTYQDHFLVYGREGKNCFNCQGEVEKIKLGGRGTYFCPKCQK